MRAQPVLKNRFGRASELKLELKLLIKEKKMINKLFVAFFIGFLFGCSPAERPVETECDC